MKSGQTFLCVQLKGLDWNEMSFLTAGLVCHCRRTDVNVLRLTSHSVSCWVERALTPEQILQLTLTGPNVFTVNKYRADVIMFECVILMRTEISRVWFCAANPNPIQERLMKRAGDLMTENNTLKHKKLCSTFIQHRSSLAVKNAQEFVYFHN